MTNKQKKIVRLTPNQIDEAIKNDPKFCETHRIFLDMSTIEISGSPFSTSSKMTDAEFEAYASFIPEPKTK